MADAPALGAGAAKAAWRFDPSLAYQILGRPVTDPTRDDPLRRPFGHPVTDPTRDDPLRRPFGRPVTDPTTDDPFRRRFGRPVTEAAGNRPLATGSPATSEAP